MERGRGNSRARGSRGASSSRGRGRGASNSSGKLRILYDISTGPNSPLVRGRGRQQRGQSIERSSTVQNYGAKGQRIFRDIQGRVIRGGLASGRALRHNDFDSGSDAVSGFLSQVDDDLLNKTHTETSRATPQPTATLEEQRLENAVKRERQEERRQGTTTRGARGSSRGAFSNKSVRFSSPPAQPNPSDMENLLPAAAVNPFSSPSTASPFGSSKTNTTTPFNPFSAPANPFSSPPLSSTTSLARNPFGGSSIIPAPISSSPFGATSPVVGTQISSVFGAPTGLKPAIKSSPFGSPSAAAGTQALSVFGASTGINPAVNANPFGGPSSSSSSASAFGALPGSAPLTNSPSHNPSGISAQPKPALGNRGTVNHSTENRLSQKSSITFKQTTKSTKANTQNKPAQLATVNGISTTLIPADINLEKSKLAVEIEQLLSQKGIIAPTWPTSNPGDPRQKAAVEAFWHTTKAYRAKVRTCLMRNGYLDDPDKPKKLSEAIDFKGTCEEMCPEFEKITRIMEHDVQGPEKELQADGQTYWPSLPKMIKALARSAAGQDAPLPEDVRSPAALRRTLDYLVDSVLGENNLETVHGFLWNRTRAIRRDFVFQQSSMSSQELVDQVYCLEIITRFHVIALHQMSVEGNIVEDFSEQQEVEQLGKALLSLIHAYEDCQVQGISCDNEGEFRAYYVLFNSQNTGILEAVQDWGYQIWGESDDIRTAVSLVETLQNIWDTTGPLRPHSSTSIAQNAFRRFFVILEDTKVSYTMACFAEIHFNTVRKAALKTILAGYRKQRDQTKDWTLSKLNDYLFFDDEDDIIPFGEAYGLNFEVYDGDDCLSFESDDSMMDPFPKLKQSHSKRVVERKRGNYTLPHAIHQTVYEDPSQVLDEEDSMFVPLPKSHQDTPKSTSRVKFADPLEEKPAENSPFSWHTATSSTIAGPVASSSANEAQDLQTHSTPSPFIPATPAAGRSFPQQPATSASIFIPSTQPQTENSVTTGSGIFSFLGQGNRATSNEFKPEPVSLFALKQSDTETKNTNTPTATPSLFKSPGIINSATEGIEQKNTWQPPISSIVGSLSNATSTAASPFPLPGQNSDNPALKAQEITAHSLPTTVSETSSSSPFNSQAQTQPKSFPTNTTTRLDPLKQEPKASQSKKVAAIVPPSKPLGSFPEWVMLCQRGLVDQFTEFTVETLLTEAVHQYLAEERERNDKIDRDAADEFRRRSLATKYSDQWRKNAHLLWLRRKGKEARELRRQMATESHRKSIAAMSHNIVEDFKVSQRATQLKETAGKSLSERHKLDDVHSPNEKKQKVVHRLRKSTNGEDSPKTPRKKQLTDSTSPKPSNHRRIQSEDVRRSIMRDGLTLPGGSFITRSPKWSPEAEDNRRRQISGVKTDYFRLKARGIYTLPDGTPLAKTAAVHLMNHKRSFDSISNYTTPDVEDDSLVKARIPSIVLAKLKATPRQQPVVHKGEDVEAIKARAREIMARDKEKRESKKKRLLDDSEEELFAKAKRIREQMDEGAEWYRAEIDKSHSRSSSR